MDEPFLCLQTISGLLILLISAKTNASSDWMMKCSTVLGCLMCILKLKTRLSYIYTVLKIFSFFVPQKRVQSCIYSNVISVSRPISAVKILSLSLSFSQVRQAAWKDCTDISGIFEIHFKVLVWTRMQGFETNYKVLSHQTKYYHAQL